MSLTGAAKLYQRVRRMLVTRVATRATVVVAFPRRRGRDSPTSMSTIADSTAATASGLRLSYEVPHRFEPDAWNLLFLVGLLEMTMPSWGRSMSDEAVIDCTWSK